MKIKTLFKFINLLKISLWHRFINFIRSLFRLNRKPTQNDELIKEATTEEEIKSEGVVLESPASTSGANTSELQSSSEKTGTESAIIEAIEQTASTDASAMPENGSKQMSAPEVKEAASVHVSIVSTTVATSVSSAPAALPPHDLSLDDGIKIQAPELDSGEKKPDSFIEEKPEKESEFFKKHDAFTGSDKEEDRDDEFFDCEESVNESSSQASDASGSLASSSDVSSSKAETCKQAMVPETRKILDEMMLQKLTHPNKSRPKGPAGRRRPAARGVFQEHKAEIIETDNKDAMPTFSP